MSVGRVDAGFLGTGWGFPPTFGPGGASVEMVSGEEDIRQALTILLASRPGERPMQELFGCPLDQAVFAAADKGLINRVITWVHDAVLAFEPRVRLLDVDVTVDATVEGLLHVRLDYVVVQTNSRYNLVFPFYLLEAGGMGA